MFRSLAPACAALMLLAGPAALADHSGATLNGLEISDAWARASAGAAGAAAAYLTVVNGGESADRLIAADSPSANRVELHTHEMADGVARMRQVPAIDLPPGETVSLAPGGLHIMLMDLPAPLMADTAITLELTFENAGTVTLTDVPVRSVAARDGAAGHGHGAMQGHGHGQGHGQGHGGSGN